MANEQVHRQHLHLRAGFGLRPSDFSQTTFDRKAEVDAVFASAVIIQPIQVVERPATNDKGEISPFKILVLILQSKKEMETLNLAWLDRMAVAKAQLREKMTLFWHNHFATSAPFGYLMQVQHNMLRTHALGNFRTLLHAVSKDPAMIMYLNNQENKKNAPNENFAREVMELFTLGEGNYSENDIKDAARTFTGWMVNLKGEYEFKAEEHDNGQKTIFGKTGYFSGEDVIEMLLENKQTAHYICKKIYREFVSENIREKSVLEMADVFYNSGYDIEKLMRHVFMANWFYSEEVVGSRIASPVELIVRYKRLVEMKYEDDKQMLALQQVLGQLLCFPPNVAGWKGGRSWIDSSSLLQRTHLAQVVLDGSAEVLHRKPAFEEKPEEKSAKTKKVKVKINWQGLQLALKDVSEEKLIDEIIARLIQSPQDRIDRRKLVLRGADRNEKIIRAITDVMRLPEFQLI
jgi:uncharacterized protein (DUF1800 family)